MSPKPSLDPARAAQILLLLAAFCLRPGFAGAAEGLPFHPQISGHVKTLNFFTQTTGFNPELADNPFARGERGEQAFQSMERARLKMLLPFQIDKNQRVDVRIDYDHQAHFGSFVNTGDFRFAESLSEDRQFLDLSQTMVEREDARYLHRLYRASVTYRSEYFDVEVGRQQIDWGKGYFFTPTDVFNPFSPTQIEMEERDGVDAVNFTTTEWRGYEGQFIYTPRGRRLHPQRIMGRVSRTILDYEIGLLGGRIARDHAVGMDFEGYVGSSTLRGEMLYREVDQDTDDIRFTVNMDRNLPGNFLVLGEYHFNSRGRRDTHNYETDRFLRGDIRELAKNYAAFLIQHDLTPLFEISNRAIMNMDDSSFYIRPEAKYEIASNLFFTAAAQLFVGSARDEYGAGQNLYLLELQYSF